METMCWSDIITPHKWGWHHLVVTLLIYLRFDVDFIRTNMKILQFKYSNNCIMCTLPWTKLIQLFYKLCYFFIAWSFLNVISSLSLFSGRREHSQASLRLGWQRWRMHKYVQEHGVVNWNRYFYMFMNIFTWIYWSFVRTLCLYTAMPDINTKSDLNIWRLLLTFCIPSCNVELARMLTLLAQYATSKFSKQCLYKWQIFA